MTKTLAQLDTLATACMDSEQGYIQGWHRLAGNAAMTAACDKISEGDRLAHRHAEAEALLKAVSLSHPQLTTAERLLTAAIIAARANEEELQLADKPTTITVWTAAGDDSNGTWAQAFASEIEAENALLEAVGEDRESFDAWQALHAEEGLWEFLDEHKNDPSLDTYQLEQKEIELQLSDA